MRAGVRHGKCRIEVAGTHAPGGRIAGRSQTPAAHGRATVYRPRSGARQSPGNGARQPDTAATARAGGAGSVEPMGLQRLFLPQLGETRAAFLTVFKYSITRLVLLLDREYSADSQQAHAKIPRDERAAPNRIRRTDAARRRPADRPASTAGGHGFVRPEAGQAAREVHRRVGGL